MADVSISERKLKTPKTPKTTKKRTRNPEEWHKQKQKRLRIAGKEHINTNGKLVAEKSPGPDCHCRRRCFSKVPEQVRVKTFEGFYSMKTHDEQNAYLFGLMRQIDIKRKRKKDSSRRTCTFEYFIRVRGRETQVCQTAFKNIHSITERKVRVLCKKMDDGIMFPSDNRGKNSGKRAGEVRMAPEIIDQIKTHVFSIVHTHRLKDFIRLDKFTGLEINISKMWKDYIRTFDPTYVFVTLPKGQKNTAADGPQPVAQNDFRQRETAVVPTDPFQTVTYPGSGHLINIAENYFAQAAAAQGQYSAQHIGEYIHADKMGYYQQGHVVVQPASVQHLQLPSHSALPSLTLPHPSGHPHRQHDTNTYVILQPVAAAEPAESGRAVKHEAEDHGGKGRKEAKKRGPAVKQWRYTSIFHEEINGAALTAIKTRLGMYYTEAEVKKKKIKTEIKPVSQAQSMPQQQAGVGMNVVGVGTGTGGQSRPVGQLLGQQVHVTSAPLPQHHHG